MAVSVASPKFQTRFAGGTDSAVWAVNCTARGGGPRTGSAVKSTSTAVVVVLGPIDDVVVLGITDDVIVVEISDDVVVGTGIVVVGDTVVVAGLTVVVVGGGTVVVTGTVVVVPTSASCTSL